MNNKIRKSKSSSLCILYSIIISLVVTACSPKAYVDSNSSTIKVDDGHLKSYADSNKFVYKSEIYGTRDTERVYPRFFEIILPKNILYFQIYNQERFEFYYSKSQVIYIKIDLESSNTNKIDTTYQLSKQESDDFIKYDEYSKNDTSKYILQKIPFNDARITTVLKKGDATILLYNILPDKHREYLDLVKRFQFIN